MVDLIVEPRTVKTWEQFRKENPRYSIALDGYVRGKQEFDYEGPFANFNHHEDVDRYSTRSTCAQVYHAIKQGLFDTFNKQGKKHAKVHVNDCDQDVCLSVFSLIYQEKVSLIYQGKAMDYGIGSNLFNFVSVEDVLDTFGGVYPIDLKKNKQELEIIKKMNWIFEPYNEARTNNKIFSLNGDEMKGIVYSTCGRILDYVVFGRAKEIEPDTRYEIKGGRFGWSLIKEIGQNARLQLLADGIKAFVSFRERGNGVIDYVIGKAPYSKFPISKFYQILNQVEGFENTPQNCWGGSDVIGGSPRQTGSRLNPKDLEKIIDENIV